ncbi:hypothetical protein [Streptomyces niveus]|uniref:hypothetical protein n=1 Tax=Streptomyces niveus TaxID=193462 RepID=UPI00339F1F41
MFKSKRTRAIVWTSAALGVAATAVGGVALAAAGGVTAPYAQASGVINADGSIVRSKGISSVSLGAAAGRFCVKFSDPRLNVNEITPVATLTTGGYPGFIYVHPGATSECGNATDNLLIVTANDQQSGAYKQFSLLVP